MSGAPDEHNALARLDQQIMSLEVEQRMALAVAQDAKDHAYRLGAIKAEFMSIRDQMRPLLDPSAPGVIE